MEVTDPISKTCKTKEKEVKRKLKKKEEGPSPHTQHRTQASKEGEKRFSWGKKGVDNFIFLFILWCAKFNNSIEHAQLVVNLGFSLAVSIPACRLRS